MKPLIKRQFLLLGMVFFILLIYNPSTPISKAQVDNIWGVNLGDSRIFQIQREFQGSVTGITDNIVLEYYVINNFDFNSNNISDIALSATVLTSTLMPKYNLELMDDQWWYWTIIDGWVRYDYVNFYFKGYSNQSLIDTLERPFPLCWTFMLVPIKGNDSLHSGVNWTYSLNYINASIPNYLAYETNDQILINVYKENQLDLECNTYYNVTGEIIWDKTTGWLDSIYFTKTYASPLNYSLIITVNSLSSYNVINISNLICWIGLMVAIGGLTFMTYVYIRYRRLYSEER